MAHVSDLIATDINAYLEKHQHKSLLRFITCGSVDDGKSTLIGRLLYESKMLFDDQLAALEADSKKVGTRGGEIDYALLLDGLAAEREQGITIDVAYRFFSTDRRKFIVADTPGHEQYTRNMVTGASTADLAIILVDARKGLLVQTRRHSTIVSLLGIRHVVLAINKMDLVDYSQAVFEKIQSEYLAFAQQIGLPSVTVIPISGVAGDNIVERSANTPWYTGPVLMPHLETVSIDEEFLEKQPFRMPVQWVNRPNLDFRGFAGTIAGGSITPGTRIRVLPSGQESTVTRIVSADGDFPIAVANQSITLTLADEIDISRGDVICTLDKPAQVASQFEANLVWMGEQALEVGRSFLLKIATKTVTATVSAIAHQLNVNTQQTAPADKLEMNGIGLVTLKLDRAIAFDPYSANRDTGGFILIDRIHNGTVAAGMLVQAAADAAHTAGAQIDAAERAAQKHQKAQLLLLQGDAQSAEKLAVALEGALYARGHHCYRLAAGHYAHAGEVAAALLDAGLIVIATQVALPDLPPALAGATVQIAAGANLQQALGQLQA
ncbi:MAG: sulfate adenylyltransferase subunit CysN [Brachymonas sp.]|jgi:bifunctional enzyme CysN/CysC